MKHDFDWSEAKWPWCKIGPDFKREVERIVGRKIEVVEPLKQRPQAPIVGVHYPRPARSRAEVEARRTERLSAALRDIRGK